MNPSTNSAEVEAAAAAWFAKREGGNWNATDQAELDRWLDSATSHRIAFIRIVAAWERSGRLKALGAGVPPGTIPPRDAWGFAPVSKGSSSAEAPNEIQIEPRVSAFAASIGDASDGRLTRVPGFKRRLGAIAAGLVVAAATAAVWYFSTTRSTAYSTPVGALASIPLSDGSNVTLNTDSQIQVDYTSRERVIKLDQGEAFFEVSKDPGRPFIVEMANKRVTAVGTKFSVRRGRDDIRVFVTEGRVQIDRKDTLSRSAATQVTAGSEAHTKQNAVLIDRPEPTQVEQILSWRTGYLVFHDTPLADAIAEFNRYSTRKVVIDDPTLASLRIGGRFRSTDADAFLWLLQSGFPISVAQRDDRISLTRRLSHP
jgi:transmembrane sensor